MSNVFDPRLPGTDIIKICGGVTWAHRNAVWLTDRDMCRSLYWYSLESTEKLITAFQVGVECGRIVLQNLSGWDCGNLSLHFFEHDRETTIETATKRYNVNDIIETAKHYGLSHNPYDYQDGEGTC